MISALDTLTGDARAFRRDVWASARRVHDIAPETARGYLSLDDVDAVVTASGLRTPAIRIVREGRILPASSFTRAASIAGQALTGLVDARRVLDEVRGGATVVLQGLHRYWPPLTDLITALERELGHPCQANAYLTPAGSQGFAPHRDTHDVFVVQSEGAKTWRLGEEGEEEEVELHPGRVLYLPTGTRHSARAQDDLSLHVTIGINQFTWRGLVRRALLASLDEIEDGHLPAGWLDDPTEVVEGLRQRLAAVAEQLATSDPTTVVVAHEQAFLTSRPPRLAGGLVDALRGDDVDDDTPLRRRSTSTAVLRGGQDNGLRLLLGDRTVDMPAWLRPAMEQILAWQQFRPADLAETLDPQSRIVLCRRLIREGLLTPVR